MRTIAIILGGFIMLMGLLWAGQGAGIIMWPASSFMLAQGQWVAYGLGTAAVGMVVLLFGLRRRR